MVYSVAIHLALFMIADGLLSDEAPPSITNTTLLVSIEPLQTAGDMADDRRAVPAAQSDIATPDKNRQASRASDQPSEMVEAMEMVVAAEISPRDLKLAIDATSSENQAAVDREDSAVETNVAFLQEDKEVAPFDVVVTTPSDKPVVIVAASRAERPRLARAALSSKQ